MKLMNVEVMTDYFAESLVAMPTTRTKVTGLVRLFYDFPAIHESEGCPFIFVF